MKEMLAHPPAEAQLQAIADTIHRKYTWEKAADNFYQLLLQANASQLIV